MDFREDEFDVFEKGDFMETIRNVEINQLHDFKNHPFKVEINTELCKRAYGMFGVYNMAKI